MIMMLGWVGNQGLVLPVRAEIQSVNYYLPYPGILPDHPLYWLKMIRDRVQLLLMQGQEAKTSKLLLYADKRLGAGWSLIDEGKVSLGVTTVTKGEKYLEKAMLTARSLSEQSTVRKKLDKARQKHQQVILMLQDQVDNEEYEQVMARMVKKIAPTTKLKKQEEIKEKEVELKVFFDQDKQEIVKMTGTNALNLLENLAEEKDWEIEKKQYDFGSLVISVDGCENSKKKSWIYFVNGESGQVAADKYQLKQDDKIEWKYIEPKND